MIHEILKGISINLKLNTSVLSLFKKIFLTQKNIRCVYFLHAYVGDAAWY